MSDRGSRVIAEVIRSGVREGCHRGSVLWLNADGSRKWSVGDADATVLPRSCNKPIQALGLLRAGLDVPADLLALICASHSGEAFHLAGVRRILALAGLPESALQTPPDWPMEERVKEAWIAAGGHRERIVMNCSGKHAAMLVTCVRNGWPTENYLAPDHPLQVLIADTFAECTGEPVRVVAVDGCGAPLFGTSLAGLARAFRGLALAAPGTDGHRVAEAMRRHPEMVSGTTRPERALHRAVPGFIGKIGAEAVFAAALPDGRAVALKVDDGSMRVPAVVLVAALAREGVWQEPGVDADAARRAGEYLFHAGDVPIGELRATLD